MQVAMLIQIFCKKKKKKKVGVSDINGTQKKFLMFKLSQCQTYWVITMIMS